MPLLQVRDFPADLYEKLREVAAAERRTIAQQTVVCVSEALAQPESDKVRRQRVLAGSRERVASRQGLTLDPVALIREDRER